MERKIQMELPSLVILFVLAPDQQVAVLLQFFDDQSIPDQAD